MGIVTDEIRMNLFKSLREYRGHPYEFAKSVLGMHLIYKGQKDILDSLEKYLITVVTSGHSTGKTAIEAVTALYWLSTRYKGRVIVIAPTWRQLQTVFYAEVSKWYNKSILRKFDMFLLKNNIMQFNHLDLKKEWFMLPISPKSPDQLQGQHGDKSMQVEEIMKQLGIEFIDPEDTQLMEKIIETLQNPKEGETGDDLLVIVDEASGVKDEMMEVLQGADPARILVCGNMTKTMGFFYEWAFGKRPGNTNVIRLSSDKSPWMKKETIESIISRYGKDSNVYKVRVAGLPPDGDDDVCIPRELVENAKKLKPKINYENTEILGVDPARFGGDYTVGYSSIGSEYFLEFNYDKKSTMNCIGNIVKWCQRTPEKLHYLTLDATGVGGPIADRIYEMLNEDYTEKKKDKNYVPLLPKLEVLEINNGGTAINDNEYANTITEMFFTLRDQLESGEIVFPDDDELIQDIISRKYEFTSEGKFIVEQKKIFRKRIKRSPGKGDAFLLTVYGAKFI